MIFCGSASNACLYILVAVSITGFGASPDLIVNGGFEQGAGEKAAAWLVWPPRGKHEHVSSVRDPTVKHSGAFSGRITVDRDDFDGIATFHHANIPVQSGGQYLLTFWEKARGGAGRCGIDIQLRADASRIAGSRGTGDSKGTFDWRQRTHRFTVPDGIRFIGVVPYVRGKGRYWVDDIRLFGLPRIQAARARTPPRLDGVLDDACWTDANRVDDFQCTDGEPPQRRTQAWAAFDADHVYFAFRCERKPGDKLKADVTQRDGDVWTDDDIELFLDPSHTRRDYYQFVVNPTGVRYDSHRTNPAWNADWQAMTTVTPTAWNVEIAIPLRSLPIDLDTGPDWCVNFCRANKWTREASSWSCTFGGFHNPGRFGRLLGVDCEYNTLFAESAHRRLVDLRRRLTTCTRGLAFDAPGEIAGDIGQRMKLVRGLFERIERVASHAAAANTTDWRAVRRDLDRLGAEIAAVVPATQRLRVYSFWKRKLGQSVDWGVLIAGPMVKVFPDGHGLRAEAKDTISLVAARGEYESAQVVVIPFTRDLAHCQVRAADLTGPRNARIPVGSIAIHPVGTVHTEPAGYNESKSGDWPDPLLPFDSASVPKGRFQSFWITVHVPYGTPAGEYTGRLIVETDTGSLPLTLNLTVWGFDLPKRGHLATPFGCGAEEIAVWYFGQKDYRRTLPVGVWLRWCRFLLDYRLSPTRAGRAYLRRVPGKNGASAWDFSTVDRVLKELAPRIPRHSIAMAGTSGTGWRGAHGGLPVAAEPGHGGQCALRVTFPATERWADISRSLPADTLAARRISAVSFWIRAGKNTPPNAWTDIYLNAVPTRYLKHFAIGAKTWHKVVIPLAEFRGNRGEGPLTLDALSNVHNLQFVIAGTKQPITFWLDDIRGESADDPVVVDDFEPESRRRVMQDEIGGLCAHWKRKGWFDLGHIYGFDELRPGEYAPAVDVYRALVKTVPGASLMQTYYVNRTPTALVGPVRIWCAITSVYNRDFLEARRAAGDEVWLYVCCGPKPPYANFFIDQPAIDHRILFWQAWQRHATGVLYWRVNYWHGNIPSRPTASRWPDIPWSIKNAATYRELNVNGDGWLVYPGPNMEPCASVRLENIRDGIEDFEYLWLLRNLASRMGKGDPATLRGARALLTVGDDISKNFTEFVKAPNVLTGRRAAIAEMILKLKAHRGE